MDVGAHEVVIIIINNISTGGPCPEELEVRTETGNILLFRESLRCPCKRLVNYKFLVSMQN